MNGDRYAKAECHPNISLNELTSLIYPYPHSQTYYETSQLSAIQPHPAEISFVTRLHS